MDGTGRAHPACWSVLVAIPFGAIAAAGWLLPRRTGGSCAVVARGHRRHERNETAARPAGRGGAIGIHDGPPHIRPTPGRDHPGPPTDCGQPPPRSLTPAWRWLIPPSGTAGSRTTTLLNACARTELIPGDVRGPFDAEDGAERWPSPPATNLAWRVGGARQLAATLSRASVLTESFCTIVVPEDRRAKGRGSSAAAWTRPRGRWRCVAGGAHLRTGIGSVSNAR